MSEDTLVKLDAALAHVPSSRRDLLKRLLVGAGAVLLAPMTNILAAGKSNTAISNCIYESVPASEAYPLHVKVTDGGAVVLTGKVGKQGLQNEVTQIARKCGATKVTNRMGTQGGKPKTPPGTGTTPPAK